MKEERKEENKKERKEMKQKWSFERKPLTMAS